MVPKVISHYNDFAKMQVGMKLGIKYKVFNMKFYKEGNKEQEKQLFLYIPLLRQVNI